MNQKTKKKQETPETQEEILNILSKADERQTEFLFIDEEGTLQSEDEIKKLVLGDTDDPDYKYDIYWNGIQKLLKSELPKGKKYEQVREVVREEVNTFLAKGKRKKNGSRGADSRMGYKEDMEIALDTIISWKAKRGTSMELYNEFKALNDK